MFQQQPPSLGNQYEDDRVLRSYLARVLPQSMLDEIEPSLRELGRLAGGDLYQMQLADRLNEPTLTQWDAWGNRIDKVEVSPVWREAERIAVEHGLVATAYEQRHGSLSRVHQCALAYLFTPSTDIYSCPLAMTDGAARTLLTSGNQALIDHVVPHLISRNPSKFWTAGQWMTELTGGSDVGLAETVAVRGSSPTMREGVGDQVQSPTSNVQSHDQERKSPNAAISAQHSPLGSTTLVGMSQGQEGGLGPAPIRTASGPGSPAGQPGWGGGSDRMLDSTQQVSGSSSTSTDQDKYRTGSRPGSPAGQPGWGGSSDRMLNSTQEEPGSDSTTTDQDKYRTASGSDRLERPLVSTDSRRVSSDVQSPTSNVPSPFDPNSAISNQHSAIETWRLYGNKWFASAITSQIALTLARPEGNPPGGRGLALFYIELRDDHGRCRNIQINRLKDKLGTRKVPTAELTLSGTPAQLVKGPSDGVRNIAPLLNITRLWNGISAVSLMRRGLALALDYAGKRVAFGSSLADKPLHMDTLAGLQAEAEAAFHLAFYVAELTGRAETAGPTTGAELTARTETDDERPIASTVRDSERIASDVRSDKYRTASGSDRVEASTVTATNNLVEGSPASTVRGSDRVASDVRSDKYRTASGSDRVEASTVTATNNLVEGSPASTVRGSDRVASDVRSDKYRTASGSDRVEASTVSATNNRVEGSPASTVRGSDRVISGINETHDFAEDEALLLRLLTPVMKLTTGKQAVTVLSEVIEAFGGAGYVEDTGLPQLLRDAQVLPIWEGTTNVLSLDTLRALGCPMSNVQSPTSDDKIPIRTASGPGSPAGQPGWGGGSDRMLDSTKEEFGSSNTFTEQDKYRTGSGPGSPAGQPGWGGGSDRVTAAAQAPKDYSLGSVTNSLVPDTLAFQAFKSAVTRCLQAARDPRLADPVRITQSALAHAETWFAQTTKEDLEAGARRFAMTLGRTMELALLIRHAQWSQDHEADARATAAARRFANSGINLLVNHTLDDVRTLFPET